MKVGEQMIPTLRCARRSTSSSRSVLGSTVPGVLSNDLRCAGVPRVCGRQPVTLDPHTTQQEGGRHVEIDLDNRIGVEWLILGDFAEVVAGKLYLMGGGWEVTGAEALPFSRPLGIAVGIRVPWAQTNQRHTVSIEVQDEDGKQMAKIDGHFEVGRPPGIPSGQAQRVQMAMNVHLTFSHEGNFLVVAVLDGSPQARSTFRVAVGQGRPGPGMQRR